MAASRRPDNRKALINEAAQRTFYEFGYHAVTMDMVAAENGVGPSALYRHYQKKQSMLESVILDGLAIVEDGISQPQSRYLTAHEMFASLARVMLSQAAMPVLWQRESRHLTRAGQEQARSRIRAVEDRILSTLLQDAHGKPATQVHARAILSVMCSPSYFRSTLPVKEFEELLIGLSYAVWDVSLPSVEEPLSDAGSIEKSQPLEYASKRERILAVSSELFAEQSFDNVSMNAIGAALGVSGASVYRHYSSKLDILYTALLRAADALQLSLPRALSDASGPRHALEAVLTSYVDVMLNHPNITQLLTTEVIGLPARQQSFIRRIQHDYVAEWRLLLRSCRPTLTERGALATVHATLTVINDQLWVRRFSGRDQLREDVIRLGLAVLQLDSNHADESL